MILRLVDTWQGYTRCRPFLVMLTLALLFTLGALVVHALSDVVYYNNNQTMPGALGGVIIALYLGTTFVIGLVTPMRVGAVGPVLAYPAATVSMAPHAGGRIQPSHLRLRVGGGSNLHAGADRLHLAGRLYRAGTGRTTGRKAIAE